MYAMMRKYSIIFRALSGGEKLEVSLIEIGKAIREWGPGQGVCCVHAEHFILVTSKCAVAALTLLMFYIYSYPEF